MLGALLAAISPSGALVQLFPPASKFDPVRDMPDLSKKVRCWPPLAALCC
jgi:hypothetical protein